MNVEFLEGRKMSLRPYVKLLFFLLAMVGGGFIYFYGNGVPSSITRLLAAQNINIDITHRDAPLSSRAGFVEIVATPGLAEQIIDAFGLKTVEPESYILSVATSDLKVPSSPVTAAWGIHGRPPVLRLSDGSQFEHLYLVKTEDGRLLLFAEYAYG